MFVYLYQVLSMSTPKHFSLSAAGKVALICIIAGSCALLQAPALLLAQT